MFALAASHFPLTGAYPSPSLLATCRLAEIERSGLAAASIARHIVVMPSLDLTDDERAMLVVALRQLINLDPLSPRVQVLRALLGKLEAQEPQPAPDTASTG